MQSYGSVAEELAARQKRFIPVNLIVLALCLVAAVSLMTLPMLTIDMGKVAENVQFDDDGGDPSGETGESGAAYGAGEDGATDGAASNVTGNTTQDQIMEMMRDELDFTIELKPMLFLRLARAGDNAIKEMYNAVLSPEFIEELALNLMAQVAVNVIVDSAELAQVSDEHVDGILDAIREAENGNEEKSRTDMHAAVIGAATDLEIEWSDDMDDKFDELFSEMMEKGKGENGAFSTERMISVMISDIMDEGGEEGETPSAPVYTYEELMDELFASFADELGDVGKYISYGSWALFGVIAFPALLWALLGLLALLHVFMKNKTFLTWYVKWFGAIPCLLFGVAPLIARKALGAKLGAETAGVLSALGTMTWVSGGCFIALVLLSWFWLYPARRKIRRLRKQQKRGEA